MTYKPHSEKSLYPITLLLIGYTSVALYLGVLLKYKFLISDVLGYWNDSLAWQTPFHPFHVSGYPLMIAGLRGITFNKFPPLALMISINLSAFLASVFLIFQILQESGASEDLAVMGAFLFGLWPFVGLTYTVSPLADLPSIFLFLLGVYLLQRSYTLPAAFFLGLSMVTHKSMWLFVGLLVVADLLHSKEYVSRRSLSFVVLTLLPLGILWLLGSNYHHSLTWIFSSNVNGEIASKGTLPILDGLIGTVMGNGLKEFAKGIILISFAAISVASLYMSVRLKYRYSHYGIAISAAVLILFAVLNQYEIWAAVRFSRLLVIPLMLIANSHFRIKKVAWRSFPVVITLLLLFLSQFAYAWYMARVYFV